MLINVLSPLLLLALIVIWGLLMKKACKFRTPGVPEWPAAESPGLALELAGSANFVDKVLGGAGTEDGEANRKAGARLQKLDFVFIPLYVLFFASAANAITRGEWSSRCWGVVALAALTAAFDVAEDLRILRLLRGADSAAKPFGQAKWFLYFATLAAEGSLFFGNYTTSKVRAAAGALLGLSLIAVAIGGMFSAANGRFVGIRSATSLSGLGLLALALAPLVALYPYSWLVLAEYATLMRVPLLLGAMLVALPFIAFFSGAKTLLRGLFDLTPPGLFTVTLASLAVAGTACVTASLILRNARARFGVDPSPPYLAGLHWTWLIVMAGLSLPIIISSVVFSSRQGHGAGRLIAAALCGTALLLGVAAILVSYGAGPADSTPPLSGLDNYLAETGLFCGYVSAGRNHAPWIDQLRATAAFGVALFLYGAVGIYGRRMLGKKRMAPALCSALMLVLMLGWMLSGLTFFLDAWRVPVLLIILLVGLLTAQSYRSDHFYHLKKRGSDEPAPSPADAIRASKRKRVIVVAANGGGIQAGAWAAKVLYELREECGEPFEQSLRMISSVSGGSVGSACFVNWLASNRAARRPDEAAAESSLDEVAWGLAYPDFLRALIPWLFGALIKIGRGRALEEAWLLNSGGGEMDEPLSSWNEKARDGTLPAVVLNATITETGERFLLTTTKIRQHAGKRAARMDATELHTINGERLDVAVVTAARLSASFPYVTPAARADHDGPFPHVVDGGYYDNYGMATMVDWLDEALDQAGDNVESVLVIQIHGAPVNADPQYKRYKSTRGWFYQAFAPLQTILAVRDAGQIAHNDIELKLLQEKMWSRARVPIHSVTFEFCNPDAPLSWHLTRNEVKVIDKVWRERMTRCREQVKEFLLEEDTLNCGCVACI